MSDEGAAPNVDAALDLGSSTPPVTSAGEGCCDALLFVLQQGGASRTNGRR